MPKSQSSRYKPVARIERTYIQSHTTELWYCLKKNITLTLVDNTELEILKSANKLIHCSKKN